MNNTPRTSKKKLNLVRGIAMWVSYDPAKNEIASTHKYKYQVPIVPGRHVVQMKGYYVRERK